MSEKKKQIREAFRSAVFERDGHKCVVCGSTDDLDAHHITDRNEMPNGGYVKENGITVCAECHKKCEMYHELGVVRDGLHPNTLYSMISSSLTHAIEKSKELSDDP